MVVELQSQGNIVLTPWPVPLNILPDVFYVICISHWMHRCRPRNGIITKRNRACKWDSKMIFWCSSKINTVASDVVPTFFERWTHFRQGQYIHWKGALSCFDCPRAVPLPLILLTQFALVTIPITSLGLHARIDPLHSFIPPTFIPSKPRTRLVNRLKRLLNRCPDISL